jgi:predicted nucleic acid-binding protein
LRHAKAPASVRAWIESAPPWLEIQARATDETGQETLFQSLDAGEREAIALASAIGADLLLMDDRAAVNVARRRGLAVTGTLGILNQAAGANLVDLAGALIRLRSTNFRYRKGLIEAILADFRDRQS